jgi:hypothetical protein
MTLAEISDRALAILVKVSDRLISTSEKPGRERTAVVVIAIFVCGTLELNPFLHPPKADLPMAGCRAGSQRVLGGNTRASHKAHQWPVSGNCRLRQGW